MCAPGRKGTATAGVLQRTLEVRMWGNPPCLPGAFGALRSGKEADLSGQKRGYETVKALPQLEHEQATELLSPLSGAKS